MNRRNRKMERISAVYKIVNEVTGDSYIGSSRNVYRRWMEHKYPSTWNRHPNSKLYQDMEKYGVDKFRFQILVPVMPEYLKQVEQELIEMLKPTYNNINAKGQDTERHKKSNKKYRQSGKGKKVSRKAQKKYNNQLCSYNGETLTLNALRKRFQYAGIEHPVIEAKKYLINTTQ